MQAVAENSTKKAAEKNRELLETYGHDHSADVINEEEVEESVMGDHMSGLKSRVHISHSNLKSVNQSTLLAGNKSALGNLNLQ